ncbi:DedA family protein [Halorubrum xinjiangense]|uniref:DedA family protein n=1 Tax=Halorubrum xinjiangense TaxID=261291 RepID=UPI003C6FF86D
MIEPHVETALALVGTYGAAAVFVVFALEGALVGKVLPARTLFVAAVVAAGVEAVAVLPVFVAAVGGATVGQILVFVAVRRFDVDPTEFRVVPVGASRLDGANRWFDRWGLPAIAASNAVPGTRGWLALSSASGSSVSTSRFAVASMVGSVAYAGALLGIGLAVALGFESAVGLFGGDLVASL